MTDKILEQCLAVVKAYNTPDYDVACEELVRAFSDIDPKTDEYQMGTLKCMDEGKDDNIKTFIDLVPSGMSGPDERHYAVLSTWHKNEPRFIGTITRIDGRYHAQFLQLYTGAYDDIWEAVHNVVVAAYG